MSSLTYLDFGANSQNHTQNITLLAATSRHISLSIAPSSLCRGCSNGTNMPSKASPLLHPAVAAFLVDGGAVIDLLLAEKFERMYTATSSIIWVTPTLRLNQVKALCHIGNLSKPHALMFVHQTGGVRTHVFEVGSIIEKVMIMIIVNLHTLTADQMAKFVGANQAYGTVKAHDVDKLFSKSRKKYFEFLRHTKNLQRDTESTIFTWVSSQFMENHAKFHNMLIKQENNCVIHIVIINEVNLHVEKGMAFHSDNHWLKDISF